MFILDTMLVSYVLREDPLEALYQAELEANVPLYVSIQTVAELFYGAEVKGWSKLRKQKIDALIAEYVVLPIDNETAVHYAHVRAISHKAGRLLTSQDSWILATARQYGLTLVSHDLDTIIGKQIGVNVICRA